MSTRAWLVIVAMGLGSIVILGILTKVAVESNPDLQSMIRFKAAFAQDWLPDGVEEVQLRKAPQKQGHLLIVTLPEAAVSSGAVFDNRVAEYFVSRFDGKPSLALEIEYLSPAFLGCAGQSSIRKARVNLAPVRVRVADREAARKLAARLEESRSARFLRHERGERDLATDLEAPVGFGGDWNELCFQLEPDVRAAFAANVYSSLKLRLFEASPPPGEAAPGGPLTPKSEVRFDRLGRELDARGKLTGRGASAPKR